MTVKNSSWEQVKELAEIAIKNGSDFSLMSYANGDFSIDISKHDYEIVPQKTTTTPTITWSTTPNTTLCNSSTSTIPDDDIEVPF